MGRANRRRSHLFTLRVWDEETGEGQVEWRGKLQDVMSGETRAFRDWPTLIALITHMLPHCHISPAQQAQPPGDPIEGPEAK